MYNRPYPAWLILAVCLPLTTVVVVLLIVQGVGSRAPWIVLLINLLAMGVFAILAPDFTINSRRRMSDGTVQQVRRPLIGFRRCEKKVGLTGGYEVRVDGFRYEEAYLRI